MGGAVAVDSSTGYTHLLNPNRTWRNNKRYLACHSCSRPRPLSYILYTRIIILNAWIALLLITSSTNGFDGSMMNGLQSLPQWQDAFNYPRSGMLGLLNAIQSIGALVGLPFSPYVADGLGRRAAVLYGASIMVRLTLPPKRLTMDFNRLSLLPSKLPPKVLACSLALGFSLVSVSPLRVVAPPCWSPNCPTPPTVLP